MLVPLNPSMPYPGLHLPSLALVYRRTLKFKAEIESSSSEFSFNRLLPDIQSLSTQVSWVKRAPPNLGVAALWRRGAEPQPHVQGLTLVHISDQPEPLLTLKTSPKRLNTPPPPP